MSEIVLDASIAAKWALPPRHETLVDEARNLLGRNVNREVEFIVPEFFWAELGNIFWKAVQRGRWSAEDAQEALTAFQLRDIGTVPLEGLLDEALTIALTYRRSFYDAIYVALAVQSRTELVTADERLVNALGSRFPVRWLGSFSTT